MVRDEEIHLFSAKFLTNGGKNYIALDYLKEQDLGEIYIRVYLTEWEDYALSIMGTVYTGEMTDSIADDIEAVISSLRPLDAEPVESSEEPDEKIVAVPAGGEDCQQTTEAAYLFGVVAGLVLVCAAVFAIVRKIRKRGER